MYNKIISYDLCNDEKNYDDLYEYLNSFSEKNHKLESTWLIKSDCSCNEIYKKLTEILDSDDKFIVVSIKEDIKNQKVLPYGNIFSK
ncbi:CRISPR-associated protein Cas2 [Thomasclavelia ramosa]|uniref:CRISPR-associated protein Cas2 n=1 Tax=Thomasclavelia ramosa TaxID=1547 RepID=UPI0034A79923